MNSFVCFCCKTQLVDRKAAAARCQTLGVRTFLESEDILVGPHFGADLERAV